MNLFGWDPFAFLWDAVSLIPKMVYFMSATLMGLMDMAQLVLRKFAGLDTYYIGDSTVGQTGDIALSFILGIFGGNSSFPALKNAFISLIILAVIMLVVTTIIAVIRQEYMPGAEEMKEKPTNSKIHVITRSVRSLFLFLIVPVSVVFGLMFSDILLRALDNATAGGASSSVLLTKEGVGGIEDINGELQGGLVASPIVGTDQSSYIYYDLFASGSPTSSVPFSGMVFKSSAYLANRVRVDKKYAIDGEPQPVTYYQALKSSNNYLSNFGIFNLADSAEEAAQMIDDAFAGNVQLRNSDYLITNTVPGADVNSSLIITTGEITRFSKFNVALVWYYYDLWQFNFLIAFAFLVISLKLFVKIVTGLMKRIIEMVGLFLISPPIIAIMPLDNGRGFGEWRKNFMSKALMAYGAIIGMNLFFLILPYINDIKFFGPSTFDFMMGNNVADMINLIISTLFVITGLVVVESFIELVSTMIGSESAAKAGGELVGKVGDTIAKSAKYTGAAAGFATKAFTAPVTIPASIFANTETGKKVGAKVRRGLQFTKKARDAFSKKHLKTWQKDEAKGDYDNYLKGNEGFNAGMKDLYNQRQDKSQDYDTWAGSKEGAAAKDLVTEDLTNKGSIESFKTFRQGSSGEGAKSFGASLKNSMNEASSSWAGALTSRGKAVGGAVGDFAKSFAPISVAGVSLGQVGKVFGGAIKNTYNETLKLAKHFNAFSSNIPLLVTSAFERNDKAGIKSMVMAFQGKAAKDIELEEIYTKIKDEESQKVAVQQDKLKDKSAEQDKKIEDLERKQEKAEKEAKINAPKNTPKKP